ncbi:MAG: type II toxin-antitoxin system VapC family toxin [Acidobacteriota bacterium]
MLYLDTSALAKLYIIEAGRQGVQSLVEQNSDRLFTGIATYAELLAVLARCWRDSRLSPRQYRLQKRAFLADWDVFHIVSLNRDILAPAGRLIERHRLRGYDAIQLCSALWLGHPLFACFDTRLRQAAAAEGLTVVP